MKQQRAGRLRIWPPALTFIALAAIVCGSVTLAGDARIARQPANARRKAGVPELRSIDDLQKLFQRDKGKLRLVVLISPT